MALPFREKGASGATGPAPATMGFGPGVHNEGVYQDGRTDGWCRTAGEATSIPPCEYESGAYHKGYADGVELAVSGFDMHGERLPKR